MVKVSAENACMESGNESLLEDGEYVRISIEDQGIGIPEENLQKIFRLHFSTKNKGTGLGLATAYMIINEHKGFITVESQLEIGTTFRIYLPASPNEAIIESPKQEEEPMRGNGKVLIMDDEKYIRNLVSEMLDNMGYRVTAAMDGNEAVELYRTAINSGQPYDVAIIDLTIRGGMGGKETIRRLKEMDNEVKAILSSGYARDPAMLDFRKYGFKGAIAKPYKVVELSMVLHDVIAE